MLNTKDVHSTNLSTKPWNCPLSFRASGLSGQIARVEPDRSPLADTVRCDPNDEELTVLARNGDIEAFNKLIQRHRSSCMKRALLIMRNVSAAEDAVQSACRRAFQRLEQFQGNGTFAGWLARIVENECLMKLREEKRAHFVYLDDSTESETRLELVGQTTNPEDELGGKEVRKILLVEMSRMPPLFRNIMMLHDSEQLPIRDVAEHLGLSVPAAKSRLLRARRELRSRIGKHCGKKGPGTLLETAAYSRTAYARAS